MPFILVSVLVTCPFKHCSCYLEGAALAFCYASVKVSGHLKLIYSSNLTLSKIHYLNI
jgi:hypothetical protein